MSARSQRILWSPHQNQNRFIIGSTDLRLYDWVPEGPDGTPTVRMIAVNSDVPLMKCFAWSADPSIPDLVAVGLTTGRTMLVRLHSAYTSDDPNPTTTPLTTTTPFSTTAGPPSYPSFNIRHSRACNVVTFSRPEPRLLATGLDKVRNDYCLMVWDVSQATSDTLFSSSSSTFSPGPSSPNTTSPHVRNRSSRSSGGPALFNKIQSSAMVRQGSMGALQDGGVLGGELSRSPANLNSRSHTASSAGDLESYYDSVVGRPILPISSPRIDDTRPIQQYGSSEAITSCAWFPDNKTQLVAGMGLKWLRIYDLRMDNASPPSAVFATKAIYGIHVDPFHPNRLASYTEDGIIKIWDTRKPTEAVLTIQTESRTGGGIARISFSPRRSGLLASLGRDSAHVRLWDIQEGTNKYYSSSTIFRTASSASSPPATVSALGTPNSSASAVVTSDGVSPSSPKLNGGSGKSMALLPQDVISTGQAIRASSSSMTGSIAGGTTSAGLISSGGSGSMMIEDEFDAPVLWRSRQTKPSAKPLTSFVWVPTHADSSSHRLLTVNRDSLIEHLLVPESVRLSWAGPGGLLVTGGSRITVVTPAETKTVPAIRIENTQPTTTTEPEDLRIAKKGNRRSENVSNVVLQERAMAKRQQERLRDVLAEDVSVVMRRRAVDGYNMKAEENLKLVKEDRALRQVWAWMARSEFLASMNATVLNGTDYSYQGLISVLQANLGVGFRKNETEGEVEDDLLKFPVATKIPEQRRLALTMCGWGFARQGLEEKLNEMERNGLNEKAAGWAFFHGDIERGIRSLNAGKDERHKLLSTALAGYSGSHSDLWKSLCKSLSRDLDGPYLKAIFAYIGTGEWKDVLEIEGLSLRDRVGVALRFLEDEELVTYLQRVSRSLLRTGEIECLLLTGLMRPGVELVVQYVNRTGDVQSAALVLSHCVPKRFKDARVEEWVESYRALLDRWQLYHHRARFDIARGRHLTSGLGPMAENNVPTQIYVRCNFCNQSIGHRIMMPGIKGRDGRRMQAAVAVSAVPGGPGLGGNVNAGGTRHKKICCPTCRKPLPRCSLCLLNLGTPFDVQKSAADELDLWFTWCQTCRHGGHAVHVMEWFTRHTTCPVSDCGCTCGSM